MINQNNFKVIVPNEAKFIVNKDYAKNLKPTTFYTKNADKLTKPQELRRVRSDIRLSVLGKPIEYGPASAASSARYTGLQKDARHYVRIYSRDRTPWVGYDLKPSFKVREDPFCARYSEFLKYEHNHKERGRKQKRILHEYRKSLARIESDPLFFMTNLSNDRKQVETAWNCYEYLQNYDEVFITKYS